MKVMPRYKKSSLLPQKKREELLIQTVEQANMLICICILADCEGWGKKRINRFLDNYKRLLDSYKQGNEDLKAINEAIWERFDVKIL